MNLIYLYLALLAVAMATVTFSMGYLPKVFANKNLLDLFSVFGAGNLLGITLLILLPESISAIINTCMLAG